MSSESDSDEDYIPGKPEQLSAEESANEETEAQYEQEVVDKAKKRKFNNVMHNGNKINKKEEKSTVIDNDNYDKTEAEVSLDPEAEKKKEDHLWACFLEGTNTPKPKAGSNEETSEKLESPAAKVINNNIKNATNISTKEDTKDKEARIFEFAGEKVLVEDNVIKEFVTATASSTPTGATASKSRVIGARGSGGLGNLLGQLNKKNKLSTLEKSKLDWQTFKKKEGIEAELQKFNKGKDGYLDRQDFLERTDHRQFEIERDLRTSKRSNR